LDKDEENPCLASQAVTDILTCWFFGLVTDSDMHGEVSSLLLKWFDLGSHFNPAEISPKTFIIVYIIDDILGISVPLVVLQ
jgi:hypothetical protein